LKGEENVCVTIHEFDVLASAPGNKEYDTLRSGFHRICGSPRLTGIVLSEPEEVCLSERNYIIARYCLEKALAGQTCVSTNYQQIDVERFFVDRAITGYEQIHLLAHLVLANLDGLTTDDNVQDALFADQHSVHLWFSSDFPSSAFRQRIVHLQLALNHLFHGRIDGRIACAVFD
jgi:hypothetical protein